MFQNNIIKQLKDSMLLHQFPVTSTSLTLIMNAFFLSQFGYCILVRNFHNRSLNNQIKRLKEIALCLMYRDTNCSIAEFLEKENTYFHNLPEKH